MAEITDNDLPQSTKNLWVKAKSAVEMKNHGYAVSLIQAILKDHPNFLVGREMMRNCQSVIVGGPKKKQKIFGLESSGGPGLKIQGMAKKDPAGAILLIEKELEKDPYNPALNDLLHDCLLSMQLFDSAAFALETVRRGYPENSKLMHKLAIYYLTRSRADLAGDVYTDILKHDPTDGVAVKGSKDCAAQHSMQRTRMDENSDIKDLMKDQKSFLEIEASNRAGMTKDQMFEKRDRLIERYNQDPNSMAASKDLAQIFEQLEDWENAASFYTWAHSLSNGDIALKNKAREATDKYINGQIRFLEEQVAENPNDDNLRQQLDDVMKSRSAEMVENAKIRVDENPTDPTLRYELGLAYFNSDDFSSAIPHLQQAKTNPHIRTKVLLLLGRTFKAKGMFDIGIKQLADALADLHGMDSTKKQVLYEKGLIHNEMGDKTAALDCFKQIYEVDYNYRDVAQRVEASYG